MKSIRSYLERTILLRALPVLLLASLAIAWAIHQLDLKEFDEALEDEARRLATLVMYEEENVRLNFADEYMPSFSAPQNPEYFQLRTADGGTIERSRSLEGTDIPFLAGRTASPVFVNWTLPDGRRGRFTQMSFGAREEDKESAGETKPVIVMSVARGRDALDRLLLSVYLTLVLVDVALLALIVRLVRRAVKAGLHPLERLDDQLGKLRPDTLDRRITLEEVPVELKMVVETLNRVIHELEAAFRRERRFTGDVAHELRTPVAEMRLAAEIGAKWPEDKVLVRDRFEELQQSAMDLERKVAGLLELSRLDGGQTAPSKVPVPVRELVERCGAAAGLAGTAEWVDRVPEECVWVSDPERLGMILENLLNNAAAYRRPGTRVEVSARTMPDGRQEIRVSNETAQLEAEDVEHLFERFWRKETARTGGHSGLGLSIAEALAESLGLTLRAEVESGWLSMMLTG